MADQDTTPAQQPTILSLETLFTRPQIALDGAVYDITSPAELSIQQNYRLGDLGRKLANLRQTNGLAAAQQKQLSETLDAICAIVLAPVPDDVKAELSDQHKLAITEVFTTLLSADRLKLVGAPLMQVVMKYLNDNLGEKLSPGSNGSTAEAPKAG
jgi:hypothetical protein